ncbi:MAG: hypothetical protein JXN63_08550, partial [Candidatus Delongbacteria bacterium]|nr:hypothetical protein [Candidatus Delongbacteria bacterium]
NIVQGFNNINEGQELDLIVDSYNAESRKVFMKSDSMASKKDIEANVVNAEPEAAPVAEEELKDVEPAAVEEVKAEETAPEAAPEETTDEPKAE